MAQLGAAFEQFAEYLGDIWEGWQEAKRKFVEEDLVAIRDGMLGEAKEQQASEVFLRTLAELIQYKHVRIEGLPGQLHMENKPLIGRLVRTNPAPSLNGTANDSRDRLEISMSMALAEVNNCLRQQGRPDLKNSHSALLQQLREDGKLLDQEGEVLASGQKPTRLARLVGAGQVRAFTISRRELLGNG